MTFPVMLLVILLSMLMKLLSTQASECDEASDMWQHLELTCELESDL